ncbi:hypothetical protein ABIA95_003080 [Bradyrhizobium sp. LA8.1]|uniref:hypothetical protein n=1 Tax=unclassified Bradyrhizobium TaxID=2631580 RepID=UPI00339096A0
MLDRMVDQFHKPTFSIAENGGLLSFSNRDGFVYQADHLRAAVTFQYHLKAKPVSGGPPIMEMLSTPQPYTEMLPIVSEKLVEATRLLPQVSKRKILQVGIVSVTRAALADLPPGIVRFIEYLKRPWSNKDLPSFSIEIVSEIEEAEHWVDRCQHRIVLAEDPDELMSLTFDFHRKFKVGQPSSESQMKTLLAKGSEAALSYFERIGEGNLFDEYLIGRKAI